MFEFLFNKIVGLQPATFIKKETQAQVSPYEFCKVLKNTVSAEHLCTAASKYIIGTIILNTEEIISGIF